MAPEPCTVTLPEQAVLVAGTVGQVTATVTCPGRRAPSAVRWTSSDTTVATVDSAAPNAVRVSGRAPGRVRIVATLPERTPVVAELAVDVVPPFLLVLSPNPIALLPRAGARLNISTIPTAFTPPGFPTDVVVRTLDSCVAAVGADGVVRGGRPGRTTLVAQLLAAPGVRQSIPIEVRVPDAARLTIQRLEAGTPPVPLDSATPVRGPLGVLVTFELGLLGGEGGRLEFRLGGQLVASTLLAPSTPLTGVVQVTRTIDTAALPPGPGGRPLADGPQPLEVALVIPPFEGLPGCARYDLSERITRTVVLANGR